MVSNESAIRQFADAAGAERLSIFVASCAERMGQLFTGIVGADSARSPDVDLAVNCLDALWDTGSGASWGEIAGALRALPELAGDDEPPGLLAYAYDAAATLYYAARFRESGDVVDVISCSNHALNSADFVSNELADGVNRHDLELRRQEADLSLLLSADLSEDWSAIRSRAQESSRGRLAELLSSEIG